MRQNGNCFFCQIASKEKTAEVVYEDGAALAFLDIHPRALGHTVVIPKQHAFGLLELADDQVRPLFLAVKRVTEKLRRALDVKSFTIGINNGKVSGQLVEHLHVHIIPRFEGDGGSSLHSVVNKPPQESLGETANKIRQVN